MSAAVIVPLSFVIIGGISLGYLLSPWCYFNGRGPSAGFAGIALVFVSVILILIGLVTLAFLGIASNFSE